MATLLESLRGRMKQRELNAIDTVAAAAKAAARGETYDVGAIETALVEARLSMDDFEKAVEIAGQRTRWLADFEKLATASNKVKKGEAAIAAEEARFEELRRAYVEKIQAIDADLAAARTAKDAGEQARGRLLEPKSVPGTVGDRYRAAVAEAEAAAEELNTATRDLREVNQRIKSEEEWIAQLLGEKAETLRPFLPIRRQEETPESFKVEDHRKALARAQRRKGEIEVALKTAEQAVARTKKAIEDLIPQVLKA